MTRNDLLWVVAFAVLVFVVARLFEFGASMTVAAVALSVVTRGAYAWYARRTWR